jgi:nucleotide-binding universal stress UspA family protein
MFKSILVPLDGSTFAEHAIPLAESIARHAGANLRLLQVLQPLADRYFWAPLPGTQLEHDLHEHYREQAKAYLDRVRHHLTDGVSVVCDMLNEQIDIPEAIEREVAKGHVDLVVMASHGRGTIKRFWLGSVSDDVYRTSSVPVLLVRPQDHKADLAHETEVRRILVTLDGSAQAEDVLEPAFVMGQSMNAELNLLRVVPPSLTSGGPSTGDGTEKGHDHLRSDPLRYLHRHAEILRARGAQVRTQVIASAEPAEAIVAAAVGMDLIAMLTQARRGVSRLVRGSVVAKVVHNSVIPVLISRPYAK